MVNDGVVEQATLLCDGDCAPRPTVHQLVSVDFKGRDEARLIYECESCRWRRTWGCVDHKTGREISEARVLPKLGLEMVVQ
jgi:hypothetical protein